jgi:hypothetical protein
MSRGMPSRTSTGKALRTWVPLARIVHAAVTVEEIEAAAGVLEAVVVVEAAAGVLVVAAEAVVVAAPAAVAAEAGTRIPCHRSSRITPITTGRTAELAVLFVCAELFAELCRWRRDIRFRADFGWGEIRRSGE